MPYKSSILPHKIFYNAMFPEILQKCKAATKFLDFIKPAKMLIGWIKKGHLWGKITRPISYSDRKTPNTWNLGQIPSTFYILRL